MKSIAALCTLTALLALAAGCNKKPEDAGAPTPPPPMQMNGQAVPSEGAHYVQQMQQQGKPVGGNAGR